MLSIYPAVYLLSKRKRAAAHMQGTVFTIARSKIVPAVKNLYHIQCQIVDALGGPVCKTPASFPWKLLTKQAVCRSLPFFEPVAVFFIIDDLAIYGEFSKLTISFLF